MRCMTDKTYTNSNLIVKTCATALVECDDEPQKGWSAICWQQKNLNFARVPHNKDKWQKCKMLLCFMQTCMAHIAHP